MYFTKLKQYLISKKFFRIKPKSFKGDFIMSIERPSNLDFPPDAEGMEMVYCRPDTLTDTPFHYCPGCGHSVVHRVLMEVVEELGIQDKTIGVAPVGCSVFAYDYMDIDMQEAAHGRASAVATGIKRVLPDRYV